MKAIIVSKRNITLFFFLFQIISTIAEAQAETIPIFDYVALSYPRVPIRRKFDNLAPASSAIVNKFKAHLEAVGAETELEQLNAVNSWVNDQIEFTNDRADEWSSADQTLARGRGDCEDHAIAKMQLLQRVGYDSDRLFLVILKDAVRRQEHAILVAKTDGQYYVLDNGYNQVKLESSIQDYHPIIAISSTKSWIFGRQHR